MTQVANRSRLRQYLNGEQKIQKKVRLCLYHVCMPVEKHNRAAKLQMLMMSLFSVGIMPQLRLYLGLAVGIW